MARKGETLVVENIREYILSIEPSAHIYKVYGSGYSKKGEPDLLVCFRGRFVGLEVKDPKNKRNKKIWGYSSSCYFSRRCGGIII